MIPHKNCGILVGSDLASEWLLPWWWEHYIQHNTYPVAFADFGMSEHGVSWCAERGFLFQVECSKPISSFDSVSSQTKSAWERRYGKHVWQVRDAWMKKPYALLKTPFTHTLWLDIDCQVHASLSPLFLLLRSYDIAVLEDTQLEHRLLIANEPHYNSGVIAYNKHAPFLSQFPHIIDRYEKECPGDEELLGKLLISTKPNLFQLPHIYNYRYDIDKDPHTVITHYAGGNGKLTIMQSLSPSYFEGVGIPKQKA